MRGALGRILLVDDEPLNRELLHAHLEPEGHELSDAETGEQALERAAASPPDLVLLDLQMPGIGGLEALRRLKRRAAERSEFLPVVVVTALHDAASRRIGLEAGADDFLTKPIDAIELKLRVANLLALRAKQVALDQRNARLVELQRFKDEMTALIIHDLRNPASAVLSNVDFALESVFDAAQAPLVEALGDARDGCRRLLRLLANLLDVARAEDNHLELNRGQFDLEAVIAPIVHVRQLAARSRGLRLEAFLEPGVIVPIDADLVARVVENVLDNALRYTPRNGTIRITSRRAGGQLELRIGNTGPAIPLESRGAIFEKYVQLPASRSQQHLNAGLGLYFCRLAAEAHGGHIRIEEEVELPTVFVVSLPA